MRRRVALKLMKPGTDTAAAIARFEAERQALALMEHPNIARVYDADTTRDGRLFFVMELVRGVRITDYCDENRLSIAARLELFIPVCHAVQHAHRKGVVHRDLKPSNILVTRHDVAAVPKIIDFGVAKAIAGRLAERAPLTVADMLIGTPAYMSPEQARLSRRGVDQRSDVYSLGALLYELLAGCPPFDPVELASADLDEIRRRICDEEPAAPSKRLVTLNAEALACVARYRGVNPATIVGQVRGPLDWIVLRCLEKRQELRYQSPGEIAGDLQRHLQRKPVIAAAPGPMRALKRLAQSCRTAWTHRDPAPFAAAREPPALGARSLAVVPFAALEAEPVSVSFATGVHADVITSLARIGDLKVISRASVLACSSGHRNLKSIAAALGVAHILEGSVRRAGNQVRVSAQLIDAVTDEHRWAGSYDRELTDVLASQHAIALEIVGAVRATLADGEREVLERVPTTSQAAYAAYLRGRRLSEHSYSRDDITDSVAAFEEATALDPDFALAWAYLSMAHGAMYWFTFLDPTAARLARCKAAADEALRLRPDLPEAHLTLGVYYYRGFRDWARALRELETAHASLPNDCDTLRYLASTLRRLGRWRDSNLRFEQVVSLDPYDVTAWQGLIENFCFQRRFAEARDACHRALVLTSDDRQVRTYLSWICFALNGDRTMLDAGLRQCLPQPPDDARARYELELLRGNNAEALRILAASPAVSFRDNKRETAKADLQALACWLQGDFAQARELGAAAAGFYGASMLHREPEEIFNLVSLGRALALQGRAKEALDYGRRAMARLPVTRDALWGPEIIAEHAVLCLLAGATDEALAQLAMVVRQPCDVSAHELRVHPVWRKLVGEPRFEAILESITTPPAAD